MFSGIFSGSEEKFNGGPGPYRPRPLVFGALLVPAGAVFRRPDGPVHAARPSTHELFERIGSDHRFRRVFRQRFTYYVYNQLRLALLILKIISSNIST